MKSDTRFGRKFFNIEEEDMKLIDKYSYHREKVLGNSPITANNEKRTLMKLANYLKLNDSNLISAKELDIQHFFSKDVNSSLRVRDLYGIRIIQFYKWLKHLNGKTRPENMIWFNFSKAEQRNRVKNIDTKDELISLEDYEKLMNNPSDKYGMEKALWETMFLSGGRAGEILGMRIKDVTNNDGKYTVTLRKSKTIPRKVPLPEEAPNLWLWVQRHPNKKNQNSALWVSLSRRDFLQPLKANSLSPKLEKARKRAGIKKRLHPHLFRKTRATIYFSDTTTEDGRRYKKYDGKDIGLIFGWKPSTVINRRDEYDRTSFEDIETKIFAEFNQYSPEEKQTLENKIKILEAQLNQKIDTNTKEIQELISEQVNIRVDKFMKEIVPKLKKEIRNLQSK